jgi:hypothetical protein
VSDGIVHYEPGDDEPTLICDECDLPLCTIEAGDRVDTYVALVAEHVCGVEDA